jgi:hypothetical protein
MLWSNKVQSSLMFTGKASSWMLLSGKLPLYSQYNMLDKAARVKHSSILAPFVNQKEKSFITSHNIFFTVVIISVPSQAYVFVAVIHFRSNICRQG